MLTKPEVRGFFKLLVLEALREKPLHGYEIMKKVGSRLGDYIPSPGIVYPALRCLEGEGLIASEQAGRRRVYRITERGLEHLRENEGTLTAFLEKHRKFRCFREMIPSGLFSLIERLISVSDSLSQEQREAVRGAFLRLEEEIRAILGDAA